MFINRKKKCSSLKDNIACLRSSGRSGSKMTDIVDRLTTWAASDDTPLGLPNNSPVALLLEARDEIERLRAEGAGRYWEGRWRDAEKENERLRAALEFYTDGYLSSKIDNDAGEVARQALGEK